ncbi:MAG: hypothetical protein LUH51_08915 [Firmicutes bacterium]|nr:hypothetical protein [Bacillota bacterium]
MNKKSMKVMVALMLAVAIFGISGCSGTETAKPEANQAGTTGMEDGLSEISTELGTLYFPSEWIDDVVTQEENGDSSCSVTFSAEIGGAWYELFTVSIGENEENSVGTLTDADGNARAVSIEAYDLGDLSALSAEEQDQLYAMQEALNVVAENLK